MLERYDGSMRKLHDAAESKSDLKNKLQEFKGVGPTAAAIFMRDMASVWS